MQDFSKKWKTVNVIEWNGRQSHDGHRPIRKARGEFSPKVAEVEAVSIIEIDGQASAGLDRGCDMIKSGPWIGRVMQHANRVSKIEGTVAKGHCEDVRLNEMHILITTDIEPGGVDCRSQIDAEDLCALLGREFCE